MFLQHTVYSGTPYTVVSGWYWVTLNPPVGKDGISTSLQHGTYKVHALCTKNGALFVYESLVRENNGIF